MEKYELEKYKDISISFCSKLLSELNRNQEEAASFFGGDIYLSYLKANDKAIRQLHSIRTQIKHL